MKNTQLRNCNKVLHNEVIRTIDGIVTGHVCFVEDVTQKFEKDVYGPWVDLDEVEFIPLSEEILLKVGFEIKPFSLGLTMDRFRFIWKEEYKYWYVVDAYSQSYLTKIEFVHELQNFLFVMNSKELDVSKLI